MSFQGLKTWCLQDFHGLGSGDSRVQIYGKVPMASGLELRALYRAPPILIPRLSLLNLTLVAKQKSTELG